jgi:hypothetical protein
VRISFFGSDETELPDVSLDLALDGGALSLGTMPGTKAGVIFAGSKEPTKGLEMKYTSHGCESLFGA